MALWRRASPSGRARREAIRHLEGEGSVSLYPHRGAVVARLSPGEVREITEIRVALESLAIREALPLLGEDDFERAEDPSPYGPRGGPGLPRGELDRRSHAILFALRPRLGAAVGVLRGRLSPSSRACAECRKFHNDI